LFKNNEFSTVESKQLLATISAPIKKKVMNTYDRIITEGFKLKEYEVVKKAYIKNYPAAEIAELLDISIKKVKSIIDAIKKEGEN
jgi:DNA-binding MarR family transcriptional regulator